MRVLLVYNPHAAHQRARKLLPEIQEYFAKKGIEIDLQFTEYPGHGKEIIEQADFSNIDGIVAAGGDGTMFEVVNGYYKNKNQNKPPIGTIPTGTGNAFAHEFDLKSTDWQRAIDIIAAKKVRNVDVGHFETETDAYYFINILGFGFVSDVVNTAHQLKKIGNVAYSLSVFYRLLRLKSFQLKIEFDGQVIERDNVFVEISNTRYTGVSYLMAPNAIIDDGLLDITLLNHCSRRRVVKLFPTIFKGEHLNEPEVETFQAEKISIQTSEPKVLSPDGEILGSTPIDVTCLKQDLKTFCE